MTKDQALAYLKSIKDTKTLAQADRNLMLKAIQILGAI